MKPSDQDSRTMRAVGLTRYLPVDDPQSLIDCTLPRPGPGPHDLLVRVAAVSVNPVDTKVRAPKAAIEATPRVLGWDAAGTVETIGSEVTLFRPGDEVWYAGSIVRPGSNAEFQCVDERIAALKPRSLDFAQAAALPLTTITAWEALFERLGLDADGADAGRSLLIIGGAGGVGSIAIQLARRAGLTTIVTASRPETIEWCRALGATHVIDHRQPLPAQLEALGFRQVDAIANFADTDAYWAVMCELIAPQGRICAIVENRAPLELGLLKAKSAGFVWEFMFTRAQFGTPDMIAQHRLLTRVAGLVDAGELRTTLRETLGRIDAANLREAHRRLERGTGVGKLVLAGW